VTRPSGGVVFDLFHTLVDPEPIRPPGFDAIASVADVCGRSIDELRHLLGVVRPA